jgi:Domain of unknown function (DUF6259)
MKSFRAALLGFISLMLTLTPITRADQMVLEDSQLQATFDSTSGALIGLERKSPHWVIERRPELGVSFRLHAPLPAQRDNFVLGQKQKAANCEKIAENQIRIQWKDLQSEHGGILPMTLTATITLKDGVLTFAATLENHSKLVVETIDYPYLGDFHAPAKNESMHFRHMWYGNLESNEIYPSFDNAKGYWGVIYPTKTFDSKQSLFGLIQGANQGLYVEMHDHTQPYLLQYTFEQHPGVIASIGNQVPKHDEISGLPVHLEFRTCHFLFAQPHTTTTLVPVVLQCYSGDWHAGADIYKAWRNTWFKQPHFPTWVMDVNSWLQLQINTPEEDWRVHYKDLVEYGQECADNGVAAIQLVGWNKGGQDRGDPAQDTDPGLGTWQDLHDAIAQIQSKGVKMILFAKLNWADVTTKWYKKELYKYEMLDPYGMPYEQGGYSYTTPTQLAGINNRRRAIMDFTNPKYRDLATKEFQKILALGAEGWLWDEVCHHGSAYYNFRKGKNYDPSGFVYAGDEPISQQLRAAADKVNPDFLFAGEGPEDWLMQYFASYFRINANSVPVCRYLDSQAPLVVAATGIDDREILNLCLLDRYIIEYEPFNFKGHVTDFPLTLAYGKKIDALRRKFKSYIWDAEFHDNLGADVKAEGWFKYSVFRRSDGKRSVVIANMESGKSVSAIVTLPNAGTLVFATPEDPDTKPSNGTVTIPARSAAVIMEQ